MSKKRGVTIEVKGISFFFGKGYQKKMEETFGEIPKELFERMASFLTRESDEINTVSIVVDNRLPVAWLNPERPNNTVFVNLAKVTKDNLERVFQAWGFPVLTQEERKKREEELAKLKEAYLKGDEEAGKEYLRLFEQIEQTKLP